MKRKKKKIFRPWLTPTGVEIRTEDLKVISTSWGQAMWQAYLKWFESGRKESLIGPDAYQITSDEQVESIFEQYRREPTAKIQSQCNQMLVLLPKVEAEVLRLYFMEGRTEAEIGFFTRRSQTGINLIKNRALSRLKRGNSGDGMFARRFMRDEKPDSQPEEPSVWQLEHPVKEDRPYDPDNHRHEFEQLKTASVRQALLEQTETAQRILYLRYWCDFSHREIARRLGRGMNVVQDIEDAAVSRVKRRFLHLETGHIPGGE